MFNRLSTPNTDSSNKTPNSGAARMHSGYVYDDYFGKLPKYEPTTSCSNPDLAEFFGLPYKEPTVPITNNKEKPRTPKTENLKQKILVGIFGTLALVGVVNNILEQNDGGELRGERVVTVVEGDTLYKIAHDEVDMSNECDWRKVVDAIRANPANEDVLKDNIIHPGDELMTPEACN